MARASLAVLLLLWGCDSPPTMPGPPPTTTTPPSPPPHDRGVPFSWDNVRGILVFPGTQAKEGQILALDSRLKGLWRGKTITYNVCSETHGWAAQGAPWPAGPPAFSRENLDNLRRFLNVTAREGSQVKLNIFCTMRDNHSWMEENAARYAGVIGRIAKDYDHLTVSIANEYWHPASALRDGSRLREIRDIVRNAGFRGPIGTDDNIGCPGCSVEYNPALRRLGFLPDFHPWRAPPPTRQALRRIAQTNGPTVVISEPIAFTHPDEPGDRENQTCCTSNPGVIEKYFCDAEAEGIVMFFHSTGGLGWPAYGSIRWIPEVRCR